MDDIIIIKSVIAPYLKKFRDGEGYFEDDKRCINYFRQNAANVDAHEILLKISAMDHSEVDDLVGNRQIVADHIASLHIDDALQKGSPDIVNKIGRINIGEKEVNLYAFATRYCNLHNMEAYPVYDITMEQILARYMARVKQHKPSSEEFLHYPRYKEMMTEFRNSLELTTYNFKEIDKFIWIHGKHILQDLIAYR